MRFHCFVERQQSETASSIKPPSGRMVTSPFDIPTAVSYNCPIAISHIPSSSLTFEHFEGKPETGADLRRLADEIDVVNR